MKAWVPLGGKDYSSVIAQDPEGRGRAARGAGRRRRGELPERSTKTPAATSRCWAARSPSARTCSTTRASGAIRWSARCRPARWPTPTTAPTGRPSSPTTRRTSRWPRAASPARSLFAYVYYVNMKAALDGLAAVNGDLSGGQAKYREALAEDGAEDAHRRRQARRQPPGHRHHLRHRGGEGQPGQPVQQGARKVDNVDQTLGMPTAEFKIGSRDDARLAPESRLRPVASRHATAPWHAAAAHSRGGRDAACAAGVQRRAAAGRRDTRLRRAARGGRGLAVGGRGPEVRDPRLQRRRQDHAVQRHHRRLPAHCRADLFLRRGHHRAAAARAHPQGPAAHLPVLAAVPRPHGARQPVPGGARRVQRPLQLPARARQPCQHAWPRRTCWNARA